MINPEFDGDGYPTDQTLDAIRCWDYKDWSGLVNFIENAWMYDNYVKRGRKYITFITGGWSGNESIMSALMDNTMIWALYWWSSERGGLYKMLVKL